MNKGFWKDLIEAWLRSIGCEMIDPVDIPPNQYRGHQGRFQRTGEQVRYRYWIGEHFDIGHHADYDEPDKPWAGINLKYKDIDPHDPSFDPDKFFAPLKKWMDSKAPPCLDPLWSAHRKTTWVTELVDWERATPMEIGIVIFLILGILALIAWGIITSYS